MKQSSRPTRDVAAGVDDIAPKVSALVPCYNSAGFLQRTLDSLAAQTWPNLEILIGDDCSTDDTLSVARRFAKGRANVRVLQRAQNLGWLRNSNDLMSQAQGEICFFAFHDDMVTSDYVEKLANQLSKHHSAIMAFSHVSLSQVDGQTTIYSFPQIVGVKSAIRRGLIMADMPYGWWVPNRGLFRTEAFHHIGGIHRNGAGEFCADWTWLLHMSLLGEFLCVPEVLYFKFYQPSSLSKNWPGNLKQNRKALRQAGIAEITLSDLGQLQKFLLKTYLRTRPIERRLRRYAVGAWRRIGFKLR